MRPIAPIAATLALATLSFFILPPAVLAHPTHPTHLAATHRTATRHRTTQTAARQIQVRHRRPTLTPAVYVAPRHTLFPAPLRGSHEILVHQNEMADRDGLTRIQNDDDLEYLRTQKALVALPISSALQIDDRLPTDRRYSRPWTAQFIVALARAHYARFHTPLQVNSAVRTVEFQQHLLHINGNAAPAEGDTASPHLTGQAIDLAKHGLSSTEIGWIRSYLLPLVAEGKIDVEEEFQQSCFHISVYKSYLPSPTTPSFAGIPRNSTAALATAIR
jgi:Family of unknown function (DUF5715)